MHYLGFKIKIPGVGTEALQVVPYSELLAKHRASLHAQGLQDYRFFWDAETGMLFCVMRVNKRVRVDDQLKSQLIEQWYKSVFHSSNLELMQDIQWYPLQDVLHLNNNVSKVF